MSSPPFFAESIRLSVASAAADGLRASDVSLMFALGVFADRFGWVDLGVDRLADVTLLSRSTVKRSLVRLSDAGYVTVPVRFGRGWRRRITVHDRPSMYDALENIYSEKDVSL
jgi:DNA-binding MarR family transcriptional regulator